MNVLFYSPVDLRAGLGCERWHCDVTNSLRDNFKCNIKIVTGNIGITRWSDEYIEKQLGSTSYERLNYLNLFASLVPTPKTLLKLYQYFLWADAVHFIHGFMGQDIIMLMMKVITRKKIIVGHHAPILHQSPIHNWYMQNISRHILKTFDFHMTLNKKDKVLLQSWGVQNVNFIPSGVRTERFIAQKRQNHTSLNFLSSGRYDTPQKGFDLAVQAIEIFNNKYPKNNAVFNFLGSGSSVIDDYSRKNKNIKNLGFKKYEEIPLMYKQSDVFMLSSREEPFGLILIEAWSSGIPVLATKTEGPLDMLIEGKNGWFIQSITQQGIFEGIEKVYLLWKKNKQILLNMEKTCRNTGRMYSIDLTAKRMRNKFLV